MMNKLAKCMLMGAVFAAQLAVSNASAQEYPNDTIRMIVPYSAGGGTDTIARSLAAQMEKIAGHPVIVENVPGAGGAVGYKKMVNSPADGYTVLLATTGDLTAQIATQSNANIDLDKASCAGAVYETPVWMLSHVDNGFSDLGAFFERAKEKPGQLIVGITARNGLTDFAARIVEQAGDVDFRIVPFGNGADLAKAIQANQIQAGIIVSPVLLNEVQAGKLNVLVAGASLASISDEALRNTKTFKDWGSKYGSSVFRGVMLPADTADDVRAKLESITMEASKAQGFQDFGKTFGFAPSWTDGETFCSDLKQEVETFKDVAAETKG